MGAVVAALTLGAAPLGGQAPDFAVGGAVGAARVQGVAGTSPSIFSGAVGGAEGTLALWKVDLEAQYLQGTLQPDSSALGSRDFVEGKVLLGFRPVAGLWLKGGVHARSLVAPGGTERWVFWEARVRGEAPLGGPRVTAYLEVWRVLSASLTAVQPFDHGQGGEGGLRVRLARVWLRAGYCVDDTKLSVGGPEQTTETVVLALGLGSR